MHFKKLSAGLLLAIMSTPALAGDAGVPGPEAGVGLLALGALAVGYKVLKDRIDRTP